MMRPPKVHFNTEGQQAFEELKKRFEIWRSTTRKWNRRIPEDLWVSAVALLAWFSLSVVARNLGVDFNTLKHKAMQNQDCRALENLPKKDFIELSQTVFPMNQNSLIAEIVSVDGSVLKLYSGAVAEIIKAFKQS